MLALTKIRRTYVIDHVMPSDLDSKDIKHGLYLKEKMIEEITDDYIKQKYPDWKEIERSYRKRGIIDVVDKLECGEMTTDDLEKEPDIKWSMWMRWKEFKEGTVIPKTKDPEELDRFETYDFDRLDGYTEWLEPDEHNMFELKDKYDIMVQFQIAIVGKNSIRYFPFQDASHYNGFEIVDDNLEIYDPQVWDRNNDSTLRFPIDQQDEYYRMIFKNYKGYDSLEFEDDYEDWIREHYGDQEVRTLQTDPIRVKYIGQKEPENPGEDYGSYCLICGKQWIKTNYKVSKTQLCAFNFVLNNQHVSY